MFFYSHKIITFVVQKLDVMNTNNPSYQKILTLLRNALCISGELPNDVSAEEWKDIYQFAQKQALLGVIFEGVRKLDGNNAPPFALLMQWTATAEKIRGMNKSFYAECQRLTQLFEGKGRKTAILKGQANSLLYPDKYIRQPGDIDIYVDGGKDSVIKLLDSMDLLSKEEDELKCYHHVHIENRDSDITVEVHFRPSSGFYNPIFNNRLQKFLLEEVKASQLNEQGFHVPTMKFALAMQLAHVQRHFIEEGIGLRQITDYYLLLKNCSPDDRAAISAMLGDFGLKRFSAALMYVLKSIYNLDESLMLCPPDEKRGEKLLSAIIDGGNFGWFRADRKEGNFAKPVQRKIRTLKHSTLFPREITWYYLQCTGNFFAKLPQRIKYRSWSLQSIKGKTK